MSVQLPTFVFPSPGPVLPPSPESTIEPMPSGDDPRLQTAYPGLRDMHWYLYSALQNEETYPELWFVPPYIDIHMGDVLEPMAGPPADDAQSQSEWVLGWDMWCLLCPLVADGGEGERDASTGYPFCDQGTLSMEPLVSSAEEREWNGERKWELTIPNSTVSGADSVMACAMELILEPEKVQEASGTGERVRRIGQPFLVSRSFRGDELDYPGLRSRYNATFPHGISDRAVVQEVETPLSSPTSSPSPTPSPLSTTEYDYMSSIAYTGYYYSSVSTYNGYDWPSTSASIFDDGDDDDPDLNTGVQAAMGVCVTMVGVALVFLLFSCSRRFRAKCGGDSHSDTTHGLPTQQEDYVARPCAQTATGTNTWTDPEDLPPQRQPHSPMRPPAYHDVVTNRERMALEQSMHSQANAPNAYPPSYEQHVGATQSRLT